MVAFLFLLAVSASSVLCSPIHNGPPPFEGNWEDIYNPKRSPIHNGPPPFDGTWEDIYNPKRSPVHNGPPPFEGNWEDIYNPKRSPVHNGPPPFEGTWEDIHKTRSVEEEAPFKGHKVYRIVPDTKQQVEWLETMREEVGEDDLDFWGEPVVGRDLHIHVTPAVEEEFISGLELMNLYFEAQVHDLQMLVDLEAASNKEATRFARFLFGGNDKDNSAKKTAVGRYAKSNEIYSTMKDLNEKSKHMSLITIGTSFEGRDLLVAKFSTGGEKPAMFINSGMHSREWIAHATVTWILDQMAMRYGKSKDVTDLLDKFDIYMMPLVNPDGYDYSINHMSKRFWRKTTKKYDFSRCLGCDPNRNWDANFGGTGTSNSPCSDIYRGPYAFSEPETQALSVFLAKLKKENNLVSYYDIHAFSQLWMENYGYAENTFPDDWDELHRVALIGAKAIESVNGMHFKVGTPPQLIYAAAGGAYDWAKMVLGVKYSYALELRPTIEAGAFGFIVPASQISDSGREVLHGLAAAGNAMKV